MQVFDLTRLRGVTGEPATFVPTPSHGGGGNTHNLESTRNRLRVPCRHQPATCDGGLHMVDIHNPRNPKFAGCFATTATRTTPSA